MGSRLTLLGRVRRAQRIYEARARPNPASWRKVASLEGLGVRQCQAIYADYVRDAGIAISDPLEVVRETLAIYQQAIEEFSDAAATADNTAARIGATRSLVECALGRLSLMQDMRLVPRQLGRYQAEREMVQIAQAMADVLREEGIEGRVVNRMLTAAGVEGRSRPSPVS